MNQKTNETNPTSRIHDLLGAALGMFAALILITSQWNVDTDGPDPFYKGPLIFPIIILSMMILASLPSFFRLLRPPEKSSWHLDGQGTPKKTMAVLGMLACMVVGLNLIGLTISSWLFLSISLYYLEHRGMLKLLVLPAVMTLLLVVVFKYFLDVYFSTPLLMEWLWE